MGTLLRFTCFLVLLSGCSKVIELPLIIQTQTEWCWAAAASMAAAHGSAPIRQCEIANIAYPNKQCCLRPHDCNIRLVVVSFDRLLQKDLGLAIAVEKALPSYKQVQRHILDNKVIIYAYGTSLEGHVVVIHGYKQDHLLVTNPSFGTSWVKDTVYRNQRWDTLYVGIVEAAQ